MSREAVEKIREALQKIQPTVNVYRQDSQVEGSVLEIIRNNKKIQIVLANAVQEDSTIGQFF